ncbi:MAG: translation initiation factor [Labilithrix sp.]|nr:translation initiation factor [Labilithrix sp.]
MGALDGLLDQVTKAISKHASDNNHDAGNLLAHVTDLFGKHSGGGAQNPKPASQDPYGDPADQAGSAPRNVKPASQDPYGDPADQK